MYAIILATLLGCSTYVPNVKLEVSVIPHVKEFEMLCNCKTNIPIHFVDLEKDIIGKCWWFKGPASLRYIELDTKYWLKSNYYQREEVIFHEFGHCILNREHNDISSNGHARSMMNSHTSREYQMMRDYYVYELLHESNPLMLRGVYGKSK